MSATKLLNFRGEAFAPIRSSYATLILPVVALKQFLQVLYRFVIGSLWAELIEGKVADSAFTIVAFLIFCAISLLSYHFRAAAGLIFLVCCLMWVVDVQIARQQFLRQPVVPIWLECRNDWVIWQQQAHETESRTEHLKFQVAEIAQISVLRAVVRGGAFQARLGTVWQVYLTLCDRSELLMVESHSLHAALNKAKQLSQYFNLPLVLLGSEGNGKYAAEPLNLQGSIARTHTCKTIRCQKSPQRWHIYSEWRASSTWFFLGELLHRSGFLLFAVIVTNLMIPFGWLLHNLIAGWLFPLAGVATFPYLTLGWQTWIGLLLTLTLMIVKGAQLSREEHLYITPETLSFAIGSQKIAQVATAEIESILYLKQPFPSLLILTPKQAVEIRELQQEVEFQMMLHQLEASVLHFKQADG